MQNWLFAAVFVCCEHDFAVLCCELEHTTGIVKAATCMKHAFLGSHGTDAARHAKCCITDNVTYTCRSVAFMFIV